MKERPILFSGAMVSAILDGTKTQTRRVVKGEALRWLDGGFTPEFVADYQNKLCPYGNSGDHLWVRETFQPIYPQDPLYNGGKPICYDYAATYRHGDRLGDAIGEKKKWKPSIHMPRLASRITLEITAIRAEKLKDISGADAVAEGVRSRLPDNGIAVAEYRDLWEAINGAESWSANPWVWVIEFEVVK